MVSLVQKAAGAVTGNVALTAFQTAIRQQVEFNEAVEETKEREREAEAQRQRDQHERSSKIAESATTGDNVSTSSDDGGVAGKAAGAEDRGTTFDLNV